MDGDELIRKANSELARRRWEKKTAEEKTEYARMMNEARWKGKTKKAKKAAASKAARARWAKKASVK